ncbi:hypothetical protein SELMODRAFT_426722 [Selaginella moellendorffii]|uniref:Glycoside hydrolase family 19 catalytic domain-containing protein n=1 Tax=Selaginella moellendorffii TaxID=88036 RepID=D8SXA0_SELML|nr:hypothetical protein SELMODRAFT_426722 [Selaginella moellendorffii]
MLRGRSSFHPTSQILSTHTTISFYPTFGSLGSLDVQKRELAAYFANVKQETGSTKAYCGRGPLQLTRNYNYNAAGKAFNMNLLQNPDQVAENGVLSWRSSVWFWMQNSNCHTVITQNQRFGGGNLGCA